MPPESNKEIVKRYLETYNSGNLDAVMAFVSQNHIHHPGRGGALNREARRKDDSAFFSAFSDVKTTVEDQIAEGAKVATRVTMRCRHTGTYQNVPATGRQVTITFIDISILKEGKIEEEWVEFDSADIIRQISKS